jgi:hypothetical protein
MKHNHQRIIWIACIFWIAGLYSMPACYKGDPGYPDPNYPPEPPVTELATDASQER